VSEFRRAALGIVRSLALVGTVAGITYGAASVMDGSEEGGSAMPSSASLESPRHEASRNVGGLLRTDNRDRFALCVEARDFADNQSVEEAAVANLATATSMVQENPLWTAVATERTALGVAPEALVDAPADISRGCPGEPAAFDEVAGPRVGEYVGENLGRVIDQASPFLFHIYVLPDQEIFRIVGDSSNFHFGTEEKICHGDVCYPVTIGLYLSPMDASDPARVASEIEFVIGLR
jgi:hypothetical protein